MKRLSCLCLLFFCFFAHAQNVTLRGTVIEKSSKLPLESATVYLTTAKDSAIVDYTITDKNGRFSLATKKIKQPVFLKVSFVGFADYKHEMDNLLADKDFGTIDIEDLPKSLSEVIVKAEAPPVRIKKDTLEFNASSFKVRPDANVETLLKQLPGVEIDANGKITVNGKEVNNILVNGKPFFGKDGKIATENLPADIIDKVQVTDTKTKEEELSGQAASSDEKTINLTIQKDMNKGLFGKFTAGKGSDDRYEASGLINYFKEARKLSFLGASNNVNSIGFSMDEIFDSMGGGRNVYMSGDGSFNIDGQQYGGGNGITQSGLTGINYADEFGKKITASGSYLYTNAQTRNDYRSRVQTLLTGGSGADSSFLTESEGSSRRLNEGHNFNGDFEYKIDSLTTVSFRPRIKKGESRSSNVGTKNSTNSLGLVYENTSEDRSVDSNGEFGNDFYFSRNMKKKGRALGVTFNNENKSSQSDNFTDSETYYYQDATKPDDIRHQRLANHTRSDDYFARIGYSEPITDSLRVNLRMSYHWRDSGTSRNTFARNEATGAYTNFQDLYSYGLQTHVGDFAPTVGVYVQKKKYSMGVTGGVTFTDLQNSRDFQGERKVLDQQYTNLNANGWFNFNLSKSKSVYLYYTYDVQMPTAEQLLLQDFSSPLTVIRGNEGLVPSKTHNLYLNFNNYDYPSRSGFYLYSGINYRLDNIVSASVYNPTTLINEMSYANVDNSFSGYAGFSYDKSFKFGAHKIKTSVGLNTNYGLDRGLTNNKQYKAFSTALNPELGLTYEYGEIFTFQPSYRYEFNQTDYTNYSIDKSRTFRHVLKTELTLRWPRHVVFGADLGYTYNANIADGFRKDFYLLNTSLGYNFFGDKLLVKVKVYDILNQNTAASRMITPEYIIDQQNTVLKRYVMFSMTYKIEKFAGKKKNSWEMEE